MDPGGAAQRPADDEKREHKDAGERDQRDDRREVLGKGDAGVVQEECQQALVDQPAKHDAESPASGGQDHRLRAEEAPDVAGPGPHTAQDPDLPRALDDAHAEGADQAHQHDGHHDQAQELHDGEDRAVGSRDLRLGNVDLLGADRVPGGGQPGRDGGGRPVDGGVPGTGGGEPHRVRGAGAAVQAFQRGQREVDGVATIGLAGVYPDDADPGGPRGHGEGEDLPDPSFLPPNRKRLGLNSEAYSKLVAEASPMLANGKPIRTQRLCCSSAKGLVRYRTTASGFEHLKG